MKLMNKLFAALVLFGMSNAAFGYDLTFNNHTRGPVTVTIKGLRGNSQEAVLEAMHMHQFSFPECIANISVVNKENKRGELIGVVSPPGRSTYCDEKVFAGKVFGITEDANNLVLTSK